MTMLRPKGKALKIAKKVVPGLDRNQGKSVLYRPRLGIPNDEVELEVVKINETKGNVNEKIKTKK